MCQRFQLKYHNWMKKARMRSRCSSFCLDYSCQIAFFAVQSSHVALLQPKKWPAHHESLQKCSAFAGDHVLLSSPEAKDADHCSINLKSKNSFWSFYLLISCILPKKSSTANAPRSFKIYLGFLYSASYFTDVWPMPNTANKSPNILVLVIMLWLQHEWFP